jgi:ribosomal protein S18 acetylase RimI-like enzyme
MGKHPDIYENLIAEENGSIIGYLSMILYKSPFNMGGTAKINELVVKNEKRGSGIGTKLINAAIKMAKEKNFNSMEIGTELKNPRALDFYHKIGFENKYSIFKIRFEES